MLTQSNLSYLGAVATPEGVFHYSGNPATVDFARREYINTLMRDGLYQLGRMPMITPRIPTTIAGGDDRGNPVTLFNRSAAATAPLIGDLLTPQTVWASAGNGATGTPESYVGLQVVGNTLLASGSIYYDANGSQTTSWFASDWPVPSTQTGWKAVSSGRSQGWAAGPMTMIPERFRAALGGDVLFGQPGSLPIISRQSFGPCAIVGNARDFVTANPVPAKVLLGYGQGDLVMWGEGANDVWNSATAYTNLVFVGDYLLFIGRHGYGTACYGEGTSDPALAGTPDETGHQLLCFDPGATAKGTHAFPYRDQALVYQVSDLIDSAAGKIAPNAIKPVGFFPVTFPHFDHVHYGAMNPGDAPQIVGAGYDSERCELHVCALGQDSYGYEPGPLWHVFKVNGVPSVPNPTINIDGSPIPVPTPIPTPDIPPTPVPVPTPTGLQTVTLGSDVWTFNTSQQTLRNGVWAGGGQGSQYLIVDNKVYTLGLDNSWYVFGDENWHVIVGVPTSVPVPPTPVPDVQAQLTAALAANETLVAANKVLTISNATLTAKASSVQLTLMQAITNLTALSVHAKKTKSIPKWLNDGLTSALTLLTTATK